MNKEVEKIRKKIEERRDDYRKSNDFISSVKSNLCSQLLSYIDSLQEEPVSEGLEEAASQYSFNIPSAIFNDLTPVWQNIWKREIEGAFIAGAKWKEEQMIKKAIEREVKVDAGGYPFIEATELYDYENEKPLAKEGDKIKIIIIKE